MLRLASACAVALALTVSVPAQAADAQLKAAVAGAQRAPENTARDAARHPVETLTFWGLKPKQTVIELSPGGGYWTEILAPYAKATGGTYVATASDLANPQLSEGAKKGRAAFEAKYGDAAKYGVIKYVNFGPVSGPLGAAGSADIVITARNVHNWMMNKTLDKVMSDAHAVLKPGGILAVEEHRADPKPELPGVSNGYVSTATVIAAAEKAGFKLQAKSEVNANPKDTKDHPFGVWTLPPSRQSAPSGQPADPKFDRTKYDAIGESDRMTLRFVKAG
ncbi:MAG: methyltransferase domain-containing protein [Alphaproteobacteria bacterium]|nr:methyltransferase domain-containing protein [Alphaproteobacteria bacterium]MBU1514364.1 methyltransferase domain-containing protein [Alphaproteobacteria bacterium]MBU2096008.1 methyltransferase domain-containing protein [Alphaproteobacteria bacterium]MBU2150016.1 methyltransferase domain-containing protein [Alphaproteobacteria bacterium]MBU2308563.1 methyltransferase domain-containing protein [Alphaproteobacteria bacterium]